MTESVSTAVSTASIVGMIFSFIIAVGLPITLFIICKVKTKARVSSVLIGMATFILFALVLEQILHVVVLTATGDLISGNIWLYALYGGLAAGLFEETGRYLAMRFVMKKHLDKQNAVMYGIGHGGIEAILLIGLTEISNIALSLAINSGQATVLFTGMDEAALQSISPLWTLSSYQFYMAGIERITAIFLHISLSYLVYRSVKERKLLFYLVAIALHFLVDAAVVVFNSFLPIAVVEAILFIMVAGIVYFTCRMYMQESA